MTADVTARLAEVARDFLSGCEEWPTGLELAAALLPVVEAIAAERAAEELEAAAAEVRDNHGTASLSAKRIDARAAALRGTR